MYYSNVDAKYLTYSNPVGAQSTPEIERNSLKAALLISSILGRILILPDFTCKSCNSGACKNPKGRCSLQSLCEMAVFDEHFSLKYREHAFLNNPQVPDKIKASLSKRIHFNPHAKSSDPSTKEFQVNKNPSDITAEDIVAFFGSSKDSVLVFHSLNYNFNKLYRSVDENLRGKYFHSRATKKIIFL